MENLTLKAGDLVQLKSGGPVMTAERPWDNLTEPYASCAWFDARQLAHRRSFKLEALKLVKPEETKPPG